ncbi:UNVERIFIED_CONTAM: hypothetical protein HDU68_003542 [Siphonaria sp. JEL0065]|nr:hypothetical protein HDU68_003542 [Siphonaria sp. JEL0065]
MNQIAKLRGASFIRQIGLAHNRSLSQQLRLVSGFLLELLVGTFAGAIMGISAGGGETLSSHYVNRYFGLSTSPRTWFTGMYGMMVGVAIALAAAPSGVKVFSEEKAVYRREHEAGHSISAYFLGKNISTFYRIAISSAHFVALYLFLAQPPIHVGIQYLLLALNFFGVYGMGQAISMMVRRENAPLLAVTTALISGVMCGFGPALRDATDDGYVFFLNIGVNRWMAEAQYWEWAGGYDLIFNQNTLAGAFGYQKGNTTKNLLIMLALGFAYRLLAYVFMLLGLNGSYFRSLWAGLRGKKEKRAVKASRFTRPQHHRPSLYGGIETGQGRRQFTSVIDVFSSVFVGFHSAPLCLPWWGAIVGGTLMFRLVFTLPVALVQRNRVLRMAALQPVLRAWEATMKRSIVLKQGPLNDPDGTAKGLQKQFKEKTDRLYKLNNCNPTTTFLLPWVQVPLFLSVSLAVRRLAGLPPVFGANLGWSEAESMAASSGTEAIDVAKIALAENVTDPMNAVTHVAPMPVDGFTNEGFMWFLDLSVADPTVLLPLIVGGLHLANIESHSSAVTSPTARQRAFKLLFQSVSVLMVPIATQVPAGVALYWAISAGYSLVQNYVLQKVYAKTKSIEYVKVSKETDKVNK